MENDTASRLNSDRVRQGGGRTRDLLMNRLVSGVSTVGVGGSIAAIVNYYLQVPEELHAHSVALVVFAWNTTLFLIQYAWNRFVE